MAFTLHTYILLAEILSIINIKYDSCTRIMAFKIPDTKNIKRQNIQCTKFKIPNFKVTDIKYQRLEYREYQGLRY